MAGPHPPPRVWNAFIVALAVAMAALDLWAASNWSVLSTPGWIGASVAEVASSHEEVVARVVPGTALAAAGVKAGDTVRFDRLHDMRRQIGAGETIPMRVRSGDAWKAVEVTAAPLPRDTSFGGDLASAMVAIVVIVSLAMGLAIGLRRSDLKSLRVFAIALLMQPLNIAVRRMAPGPLAEALSWLYPCVPFVALYFAFAYFCLTFPEGGRGRRGLRLQRGLGAYAIVAVAVAVAGLAYESQLYGGPAFAWAANSFQAASVLIALTGLAVGWWEADDVTRSRIAWVAISMGIVFLSYLLPIARGVPGLAEWLTIHPYFNPTVILAGHLGLAYALLRHRIFGIGFVVNRALVYGLVSAAILLAFGLLEWLVHKVVHFESQQHNAFLDAGIALVVFLAFNKIHHHAESGVEALFFRAWRRRDQALRAFVRQAAGLASREALLAEFHRALRAYTGAARCAILLREPGNVYRDQADASLSLAGDDPIVVALRREAVPAVQKGTAPGTGFEVALAMSHRGELSGIVLLGPRAGAASYRPDELDALGFAAHQVGLDLHALDVEDLRGALGRAEAQIARANSEIESSHAQIEELRARLAATGPTAG